jgi:hypothetical protein
MTNKSKDQRGPGGSKPKRGTTATKSLGGVRVTEAELADYSEAADKVGKTRADWIRDTLQRAARRLLAGRERTF